MILNPSSSVELSFQVSLISVKEGEISALKLLGAFGGCWANDVNEMSIKDTISTKKNILCFKIITPIFVIPLSIETQARL